MKIGVNDIVDCKIGTNQVAKVYLGSNLVWEKSGSTLLLDVYPNASVAYSLRKLRTAYAGDAIKVRRSSDNTEQDIGFSSDELDTSSLLSFVGSGDGFVSSWYDQSGLGNNNAAQSSAANQPKIVSSGSIIVNNGKSAVEFDGNDNLPNGVGSSTPANLSAFAVRGISPYPSSFKTVFNYKVFGITHNSSAGGSYGNGAHVFKAVSSAIGKSDDYPTTTGQAIDTIINKTILERNNFAATLASGGTYGAGTSAIGSWNGTSQGFIGTIQELIIYETDQLTNKSGIQTNINKNYNIYWDGSQTGVLDDYPNASAAYSLRALNSAYTGASIKVRRSSDNAEQDINLLYDGSLNTSSLLSFVGSNDGFVTVWYDQSGNNEDASDSNANSQASIVLSGVLNTTNGNPAALGQSNSGYTTGRSIFNGADGTFSGFVVSKLTNQFDGVICLRDSGADLFRYFNTSSSTFRVQSWANGGGSQVLVTEPISANSDAISSFIRGLDTLSTSSNTLTNSMSGLSAPLKHTGDNLTVMGFTNGNAGLESYFSEAIMYPSDQTSNRIAIEANINANYNIYWDGSQTGLLDDYPNASAAYSLRALNSAYTGASIKVRRSSDNAEQDINLLYDGSLNTSSLLSFVGSGDGFVTVWYDQSGNNEDATQTTAAKQPKIVNAGSVILENGKPIIESSNNNLMSLPINGSIQNYIFGVMQGSNDPYNLFLSGSGTGYALASQTSTAAINSNVVTNSLYTNNVLQSPSVRTDIKNLFLSQSTFYLDASFSLSPSNPILLGLNFASFPMFSSQELIFYTTNQSTNRTAIEANINNHYTIY
jgi:hypothetical protein